MKQVLNIATVIVLLVLAAIFGIGNLSIDGLTGFIFLLSAVICFVVFICPTWEDNTNSLEFE